MSHQEIGQPEEPQPERPRKIDWDEIGGAMCGTCLTVKEFESYCANGILTDDDGFGYYSDGHSYVENRVAYPSQFRRGIINNKYSHVYWIDK